MAARHAGDVLCLCLDCSAKRKIGCDITGVQGNHRSHVLRRLVFAQIRLDKLHIVVAQTLRHFCAFLHYMLIVVNTDDTAALFEHITQIVIHDKAQIGLAAGTVQQQDLLRLLFKHRRNQLHIMVNLIVFAHHIVFELALRGQNTNLLEQCLRSVNGNQIFPSAEQRIDRLFCRRLAFTLLHGYAARGDINDNLIAAFPIIERRSVKFLCLGGKQITYTLCIGHILLTVVIRPIAFALQCHGCAKLLAPGNKGHFNIRKIIPILLHSCAQTDQEQIQLGFIFFLHDVLLIRQ